MKNYTIEAPKTATRIIAIKVLTTTVLNKMLKFTNSFGAFKVTNLQIITQSKLPYYTKFGQKLPVLAYDDIAKLCFNFCESKNNVTFQNLAATTLCGNEVNDKARFNVKGIINFNESLLRANSTIAADGWLLLQITYER